ncbi:phosphatidylserine decarboxylase [Purpureocillium lavendulum]|uniref:Phosphatidylserine decarboxylase n=1 Tax=Purpureocillium lavendulum TaxID=1247861 RepID=A0AB34FJB0_9HYPO|nr:phosphatidylserine decarboxylase [Purpureocillium lavendulum]
MTVLSSPGFGGHLALGANWFAGDHRKAADWLDKFVKDVGSRRIIQPLDPIIGELKSLIESKAEIRMLAAAMFEETPDKFCQNNQLERKLVQNYHHMLELFNVIVTDVAPTWSMVDYKLGYLGSLGMPFLAVLTWPMGTPSGHAFFLRDDVNCRLKIILDAWRERVLKTTKSQYVITVDNGGWLCKEALAAIERDANPDDQRRLKFQDLFICDPQGDPVHWGFKSWDEFFTRQFRDIDRLRPVAHPDKPEWVVNVCESRPYAIKSRVKEFDTFWIKGQNYSVAEMLGHHVMSEQFVGGTVYQAFLSPTSYHRWCSPVSGNVVYANVVDGTYFAEPKITDFSDVEGSLGNHQVYISHVATRALIFIQAPPPIGFVCVLLIGMADVSTCQIASKFASGWPRHVKKGEEIGMFHHGGSSYCLLFRKGVNLAWVGEAIHGNRESSLPVRSELAFAYGA